MKILIVDDNQTNILLLRRLIERMDGEHEAVCFTDSLQALDWCADKVPDLLLIDYMMPELDGIEFIQQFRMLPACKDIPVVMITADNNRDVRYKALEAGANDFLNKPIDKTEFLARTRSMLSLRKNQIQLANRAQWLAGEVHKATESLRQQEREALVILSKAAEYRDPETGAHIMRMSHYSKLIARQLGLSEAEQELILEASPMHDVGKVGTPDHILLKPGKLDFDEFVIMKQHADYGYEILNQGSSHLLKVAAEIAISHHEKYNGKGYPHGLKGEEIPLRGRIVAVADVFDALTSERPYKKAWPVEKAIALLTEESGEHFDPQCVEAFLSSLDQILEIMELYQE
ncbi:MAG: response regulator [Mariprofundaceae bacterium]|nr:response regulator [Mariprofundaceae bacterium]